MPQVVRVTDPDGEVSDIHCDSVDFRVAEWKMIAGAKGDIQNEKRRFPEVVLSGLGKGAAALGRRCSLNEFTDQDGQAREAEVHSPPQPVQGGGARIVLKDVRIR